MGKGKMKYEAPCVSVRHLELTAANMEVGSPVSSLEKLKTVQVVKQEGEDLYDEPFRIEEWN